MLDRRGNVNKRDWSLTTCSCETLAKTDYAMCYGGGSCTRVYTEYTLCAMRAKCIERFQQNGKGTLQCFNVNAQHNIPMNQNLFGNE